MERSVTHALYEEAALGLVTLGDHIRFAASTFGATDLAYGHGTDNALDEAVALVLGLLHLDHDLPPAYLSSRLLPAERARVVEAIRRRVEDRVPVPYLTGRATFAGLEFAVDSRVLVPRSPIAELIEGHFEPWLTVEPLRILDLCTGSGCIAVALALAFPGADVDAVDLSADALALARRNVERHGVADRVRVIGSDLYAALEPARYDLIVSNPPYVSLDEMAALPAEYRHEPALGLVAGAEGLDVVERILAQARDWLTEEGVLVVEVGGAQEALVRRHPEIPFLWPEFARGGDGVFVLSAHELMDPIAASL